MMITMHNSELADILGNLIHRVLTLCCKYSPYVPEAGKPVSVKTGVVPDTVHDMTFSSPFDVKSLKSAIINEINGFNINIAIFKGMEAVRSTNRYLTEAEPWKMKNDQIQRRLSIVRTALEAVYIFMHFLAPVIPIASDKIFSWLNTPPKSLNDLNDDFYNLIPGTTITMGDILFHKIEDPKIISDPVIKPNVTGKGEIEAEFEHIISFTKCDLRVGQIQKVTDHEASDRLYCLEINVNDGFNAIRPVASALRGRYSKEELLGRKVLVVCNLKEAKFQGFLSCAMILAAKKTSEDGSGRVNWTVFFKASRAPQ
jgi:methionyl-tRNA synthetase